MIGLFRFFHKSCILPSLIHFGVLVNTCLYSGGLPLGRKAGTGEKTAEMPNYQQLIPLLALAFNSGGAMVRVTDYWPEVANDLTRVSWSHATNSKALLDQALADSTMMIEADVSLGPGSEPIMAHPPANTSDLSLRQFLDFVLESGKKKGIKLDFKLLEVVRPSLEILDQMRDKLRMPLWLNADIVKGPGGGEQSFSD